MSDEKKPKEIEDKDEVEDTSDIISDNVGLLKAKIIAYEKTIDELTEKLDAMTKKYGQAKAFMDADAKKELLEYLKDRVDYPPELLALKSRDELMAIKQVVEKTKAPTFKSSAPLNYDKGPTARQKLDSKHEAYMKKLRGEK